MSERVQQQRPERTQPQIVRQAVVAAPIRADATSGLGTLPGDALVRTTLAAGAATDANRVRRRLEADAGPSSPIAPIGPIGRVRRAGTSPHPATGLPTPAHRIRRAARIGALAHELTHTVQHGAIPIQRVFTASTPSTYDDGGGHALLEHGPKRPESEHQARAKSNAPSYSSSGWASEEKMKTAVTSALATRTATGAKIKKTATKYYKRWTVNVTLAACGYTWTSNAGKDPVTKTESGTAVVIFAIDESTGDIERMVTAFPGAPAKEFNATA